MIYGFNNNNRNISPQEIYSIIGVFVTVLLGIMFYKLGQCRFNEIVPHIDAHVKELGIVGVFIFKYIAAFFIIFACGILHIACLVKVMEIIKEFFT